MERSVGSHLLSFVATCLHFYCLRVEQLITGHRFTPVPQRCHIFTFKIDQKRISSEIGFNCPGLEAVAGSAQPPCLPHSNPALGPIYSHSPPLLPPLMQDGTDVPPPQIPGRWSLCDRPLVATYDIPAIGFLKICFTISI